MEGSFKHLHNFLRAPQHVVAECESDHIISGYGDQRLPLARVRGVLSCVWARWLTDYDLEFKC